VQIESDDVAEKTLRMVLGKPLALKGSVRLKIEFLVPFPSGGYGYRLATEAWHPKAVVFREGKFNPRQEQADSYDVTLTAPAGEVIAASGRLAEEQTLPQGMKRLRYRAEHITDFGIASSPTFLQVSRQADGVTIRSYYFASGAKWGTKLPEYAERIINFYRTTFGFYPQEALSILPGSGHSQGGYPPASTLVVIHTTLEDAGGEPFAEWIMAHEIGHQYWGFDCVIDSGDYYHWPGIPLGIYTDRLYTETHNPAGMSNYRRFVRTYLGGVEDGDDTTIRRTWPEINKLSFDFNNEVAHGKAYAVIQMLEDVMGKEKFFQLTRLLLERYRYTYLSPEDFEKTAEEVSGQKLDWFFRDWFEGNKVLSYAIDSVQQSGSQVSVQVRRTGTAALPMDLEVILEDGSHLRKKIAREPEVQTIAFEARSEPVRARLDPDGQLPLFSLREENIWGKKKVQIVDVRLPQELSWGSNTAVIRARNDDNRPHEINLHFQTNSHSPSRGWGWDTKHTIELGKEEVIERDFILPPFPGKARIQVRGRDLTEDLLLCLNTYSVDFPAINEHTRALTLPAVLRNLLHANKSEYPPLRVAERGHFVFYYLAGDSYVESRLDEIAHTREQAYTELAGKINPAFHDQVLIYLFPDADSKRVYTGHTGMGMAEGTILAEIYNEKDRLDPYHELVHIIAGSVGDPPALFNEGLAVYFQVGHRWDDYTADAWAKAFAAHQMLFPLTKLITFTEIGTEESKPDIAYPQAASVVKYLIDTYGFEKTLVAYKELKQSSDDADLKANAEKFGQIFGLAVDKIEKAWLTSLNSIAVEPIPETKIAEIAAKYQ
jgi:hypothetical protein